MYNSLPEFLKRIFLIGTFISSALIGVSQEYHNGVRKGMIKVKFSPTASASLSQMQVSARRNQLSTGIKSIDDAAKSTSATNLYRLFPYDAKNENKLRKHGLHLWYVVEIASDVDPKAAVAKFKQLKEVAVAEVEREKRIAPFTVTNHNDNTGTFATLPFNDPMLKDQWHYDNTGQTGYAGADINLFEAWEKTAGANNIVISVHDQGVDVNHPDLKANIWSNSVELNGLPTVDDDNNGYVDDIHGYNFEKDQGAVDPQFHGTHVAGTIAAVNNNGIGVSGIAGGSGGNDGVRIMSMQILGGAPIEKSYVYAANNGAVISQNSWGYTTTGYFDQSVMDAIRYFIAEAGDYPGSPMKGGIVIFAAGNNNVDAHMYPGYDSKTMAVAALGPEWKKAAYSNFGEWIEISAPGGDQAYGSKNGVLSTIPDNQYAYIQGTSMACPHVSGIAALALANSTKQLTNEELWNKLMTGVVDVDQYNSNYQGKLGVGAIDAAIAIKNDQLLAPAAITDLTLTGMAQEFATLKWTVPQDADDLYPVSFTLYFHTQPLTLNNLGAASKASFKNNLTAGTPFSYEVSGLLGMTTYHFALTSTDRWGNQSLLSNMVSDITNDGPSIVIDENSQQINLTIDAAVSTSATHDITIRNDATGILRWVHFMRHVTNAASFNAAGINYPEVKAAGKSGAGRIVRRNAHDDAIKLRSNEAVPFAFAAIDKAMSDQATDIIGETDTTLTNSAAGRFYVTEADGFNLTHAQMYLKHDPAKGPVIVEVYKGSAPVKNNLVHAQEFSAWGYEEGWAFIPLNEQLYFEAGSTFWIVFHIPAGHIYPLGIGYEANETASSNCFMSFDLGGKWEPLEKLLDNEEFAWAMVASSWNQYLGTYLSLEPGSGDIEGNGEATTTLTAQGGTLVNGSYTANLILSSNDVQQQELRIPVNVTVTGHKADIKHIDIAEFGNVFKGASKTLEVVLDNQGYGNLSNLAFTISNPQFSIIGEPWQISAREEAIIEVKFAPTATGNINGSLTFTDGEQTYEIALFGVGTETSKINITPETQVIGKITLGNEVHAEIKVENIGAYPLKYFIPGHDTKGVSTNWPSRYHSYGYKFRTNYATESNPLTYTFQDISSTGTKITEHFKQQNWHYEVDMGFDFPYYGDKMKKIYIAKLGFTTFDKTVNPLNIPTLNNPYNPKGYISPIGTILNYAAQGDVFYKVEIDRIIIQYDNVWDGYYAGESITAQMVLYANGDIRFFYESMGFSEWNQHYLNILMEDIEQKDGILVHNFDKPIQLYNQLALGFDYPGPDIITSVENGSGVIMPGNSSVVKLSLSTNTLYQGTINRFINFISNDPSNSQKNALIQLQITKGGIAKPVVSTDTIDFGDVFQNAVKSASFTIKNEGTKLIDIRTIRLTNKLYTVADAGRAIINPGLYKKYEVKMPTNKLGVRNDVLTITYADGTKNLIIVKGKVVEAPAIDIDLSLLQETLAYGETSGHSLNIKNTGKAGLEVVAVGKQWLSFDVDTPSVKEPLQSYVYEKHNDGSSYQWIDIRKSGTQLPFANDVFNKKEYWRNLELPFPFQFYGQSYSKLKIGENGIITFEEDPDHMYFEDFIPADKEGAYIMPYWTFGGFNTTFFAKEDVGIFYQLYEDKIIITWSYLVNNFGGMGDPISVQLALYKNGTMKFQYKVEENGSDQTSVFTSIGLQQSPTNTVSISNHNILDHGTGLAYVLVPAEKHFVAPGATLAGQINIDAQNIYGGQYNEVLKIQTNVPGRELLEKPIQLTVTGEGTLAEIDTVDFGKKMIAFEYGMPVVNFSDIEIKNDGSAALEITAARMADGTKSMSLAVWMLVDGWIGKEWRWVDISEIYSEWATETPVLRLLPGDRLNAKAIFYPGEAGEFIDELVLTTSIGEERIVLQGSAVEPPVIKVTTPAINVVMNTPDETAERRIKLNNLKGKSELEYQVTIDYQRENTDVSSESMGDNSNANSAAVTYKTEVASTQNVKVNAAYNRTIKHSDKDAAEGFVGTGGGTPFTVATRFTAGPDGFNLSHIETWLRTEDLRDGTVRAEVRAGGTNIVNAVKVASGTLNFSASGSDTKGSWHQIAMTAPAAIYPNETFYVIVTYPLGIERPQGTFKNETTTLGRYYYFDGDFWNDLQGINQPGFSTLALLMYAAEQSPATSAWLSINSATEGVIQEGDTTSISITLDGAIALRGDQAAKIVITSNDPVTPVIHVPVSLHMNEAPIFKNPPVGLQLGENETVTIKIGVVDPEGHTFSIKSGGAYKGVTHSFAGGILSVTIDKDYGDAGTYSYKFIATDQFDATREVTIPVEVSHTNRPPSFIGEETLSYYSTGQLEDYSIEDFFSDPDGDTFTFTVSSSNAALVDVFASKGEFLVKPISAGEAKLAFAVTDSYGAISHDTITVIVNNVLGIEEETNAGLKIFPNPVQQMAQVIFSNEWKGVVHIQIIDAAGRNYLNATRGTDTREVQIDVSALPKGFYILRAASADQQRSIKLIKE